MRYLHPGPRRRERHGEGPKMKKRYIINCTITGGDGKVLFTGTTKDLKRAAILAARLGKLAAASTAAAEGARAGSSGLPAAPEGVK